MQKLRVITPRVPNFITTECAGVKTIYPLTAFKDEELEAIVKEWRNDLFKNRDRQAKDPEMFEKKESAS